ncbi:HD domain-containing protein [Reyranella sp.]|jgi:predicted HD phosphohydrolase|uniref:HD domain-containing protein n=1 Tax=Reyranella sp. TaxID=1929291 RepID=UPI003BAD0F62
MDDFDNLENATVDDLKAIAKGQAEIASKVGDHLIAHLSLLKGDFGGFPIDRYDHCLQAATRAHNDKRSAEYVVCALFHDIGDTLAPYNHGEVVAEMLRPFIDERNYFMVQRHGVFQGYYFWGKLGLDRNARDKYKDSPYFNDTVEFCEKYDSPSFDKNYPNLPIEAFRPLIDEVLKSPKQASVYSAIFAKTK